MALRADYTRAYEMALGFESLLNPGQFAEAHWTNSFNYWKAKVKIVRINSSSIRVELLEDVKYKASDKQVAYRKGRQLVIPRIVSAKWSANNRLRPLPEAAKVEDALDTLTKTVDTVLDSTPGFQSQKPRFSLEPRFNLEEFHRFEASGGCSLGDLVKQGYVAFCFECGDRYKTLEDADEHAANGNAVFRIVERD